MIIDSHLIASVDYTHKDDQVVRARVVYRDGTSAIIDDKQRLLELQIDVAEQIRIYNEELAKRG